MEQRLRNCNICPRECGGNRLVGEKGYCRVDGRMKVGRIAPHHWEEPCISGEKGSGAIFFAGCNMRCVFCQNEKLSAGEVGRIYTIEELAEECLKLQTMGCHNINLITASHYVPVVVEVLKLAKKQGLEIPIVYNTSAYEKAETLKLLDGCIDIYLPDFKYLKNETAMRYSKAVNYPEVAKDALREMVRQRKHCSFGENELMKQGVMVRHLVLPGHIQESKEIIKYLYDTYQNQIYISIMNQFTPYANVKEYPEINRKLTSEEYDEVVDYAIELGVEQGFIQEGETAEESFIPEFKND